MKYRKLRIAWSVAWTLAAVLLIALWVRSEHSFDSIGSLSSAQGRLYLFPQVELFPTGNGEPTIDSYVHFGSVVTIVATGIRVTPAPGTGPVIPLWAPILVISLVTITPWIPQGFSLRTLLIATTLIAIVLGLIV